MLAVSLFILFTLQSTKAESDPSDFDIGICTVSYVEEKLRFVMDRTKNVWKNERYNDTKQREECCTGYHPEVLKPLTCSPICDPPCENSDCMAPDTCVCHPRHVMINNSSNSCSDVCDSCVNGVCLSSDDEECSCFHGYRRDPRFSHICDPICSPTCINASCIAPSVCKCYDGYKPHSDETIFHICVPHCSESCVFGTCTEPGICTCFDGYINDKDSPSICLPICNRTCENGDCYAPDMCKCRQGFTLHPRNPYRCIPETPEPVSAQDNTCKLIIPRAVMFDSDCFLIRENITLSVPSNCSVTQSQSRSYCSSGNCDLNLRCSAVRINGSSEIHCFLEEDEFETDSVDVDHIINGPYNAISGPYHGEWTDAILVIYSFQNFNSSIGVKRNTTKEWTFLLLNKAPVCGKKQFAVKLRECKILISSSLEGSHYNSTFMFWLNVFLIVGFLLMVGVGIGGFLWARHRKLNNPLNYREDMVQGYYNNECYENRSAELISDDDSDHYSDAPL